MNVSLSPELEKLVKDKVASGRYNSSSEVIREALRLLEDQDRLRQMRLEELRREIAIGIEQLERGEYRTYDSNSLPNLSDEIKAKGRQVLAKRERKTGT